MAEENDMEGILDSDEINRDEETAGNENETYVSDDDPGEQHEFEIIDQVDSDEGGEDGAKTMENGDMNSDGDKGDNSSDTDFDDTQLHEMLEKGIDKDSITSKKTGDKPADGAPIIRNKIVLQELESDPFDILPEGWVCATHNCGMPIYLHRESRVCTMARPYYLGSASTRKHDIPISAIPCLQYRNHLKRMEDKNGQTSTTGNEKIEEAGPEISPKNDDSSLKLENGHISSPAQSCDTNQQVDDLSPSESSSPQKMWMVAQDTSGKCPSQRKPEELHTGKPNFTDEISHVEPDSQLTTSHSNNNTSTTDSPRSPGGENIAVILHSSTLSLNGINDDVGQCVDTKSLCCQENDREKDISITEDCLEEKSYACTSMENISENGFDVVNNADTSHSDEEVPMNCENGHTVESKNDGREKNAADSSQNIVSEETASSVDSSQLVTSNTSTISEIKRKIEDLKRRGGKQRKLMDGSAEVTSTSDNNIAVNVDCKGPEDQLRFHTAEVKIKTAEERAKESLLDTATVHNYCAQLFQFKTIVVRKYRTWRERRKHLGGRNRSNRPELPSATKLITCPISGKSNANGSIGMGKQKEFVLNPSGKSFLCILHEYMQRTLKIQPTYSFIELENSKTPYGATVMINNIEYGTGYASSKKMAKQEAAKETLKILIPDLSTKISEQELKNTISDLSFFDEISVEDPRIYDLGNKVGQPSPFQLLRECLRRNFGMGATQFAVKTTALRNQKCEFSIQVGKHSASVVAKNKRDGKQLAAQAILAKLHPHVPSWGSLLRLYATNVEKPMDKVEEMNEIKTHVPNKAVLENLREEMRKLHKQKEAIQSKGKMMISTRDLPSKMSCVDL